MSTSGSSTPLPRSPRWWPRPPGKLRRRRRRAATTRTRLRTPTRRRTPTHRLTRLPPRRRQPAAHLRPPPSSPGEMFIFQSLLPAATQPGVMQKSMFCCLAADWLPPLTLPVGMRKHCKSIANPLRKDRNATQEHHVALSKCSQNTVESFLVFLTLVVMRAKQHPANSCHP